MNLSAPFIERPVATTLLTIAVCITGAIAFVVLPVAPLPQVDFPTISVSAGLPGASAQIMAASVATLKVIEEEKLLFNTQMMGKALRDGLDGLKERFKGIGDVRGMGLMQAIELVKDRGSKEPDPQAANRLMEATKKRGLLIGKGGLWGQTIRFAPPMCLTQADADFLLEVLDESFSAL